MLKVVYERTYAELPPYGWYVSGFLTKRGALREARKVADEKSSSSTCIAYDKSRKVVLKLEYPKTEVEHGKVVW